MQYQYIAIEGNIGAGKSTLSTLLAKHYNARLILEEYADNNFLPKFYQDRERYAFPLELSFLADRFKQFKRTLLQQELFHEKTIADYHFIKSKLFARVNLPDDEYELFENLYDIAASNLPQPELLIYLHAPISKLQENIKKRNRSYELQIPDTYLESIQATYQEYLKTHQQKTLFVDVSNADFLQNPEQLQQVIAALEGIENAVTTYLEVGKK